MNPADNSYDNWGLTLQFIADVVDELNIGENGVRVGMVVYSRTAYNAFFLNSFFEKEALKTEILNTGYMGSYTNTSGGIKTMHFEQMVAERGARANVNKFSVVITDGESNTDKEFTITDAQSAHNDGITMMAIGITANVALDEVLGISSPPQELNQQWFLVENFLALSSIVPTVASQTCAHTCSTLKADIVFIVDSSGTIRDNNPTDASYDNWTLMLNFMANVVNSLTIGINNAQVGFVRFSDIGENMFFLNTYSDKTSVMNAINGVGYFGGYTNTSGGLYIANHDQFTAQRGDRSDAENIAIVIMDGDPNRDESLTVPYAEELRDRGVKVWAIGISDRITTTITKDISSLPQVQGSTYWEVDDFQALSTIESDLVDRTCSGSSSEGQYCFYTEEEGTICLCIYDECDIRPLNGTECTNVNECLVNNGMCQHTCVDTEGSFRCSCPTGFLLATDGFDCEDVNECDQTPCGGNQCINTYGSYTCLSSANASPLTGNAVVAGTSSASAGLVSQSTVVLATCLAAVGTLLVALIVALGVRRLRTPTTPQARSKRLSVRDNFGFTIDNKFHQDDSLNDITTASSLS